MSNYFKTSVETIHKEITKVNSYNAKKDLEGCVDFYIKTCGEFFIELNEFFDKMQYNIDPSDSSKRLLEAQAINAMFIGLGTALTNKLEAYYYLNPEKSEIDRKITVEDKKKMAQQLTASVEGLTKSSEHMQRNISERINFFKR
jgi:hypothetical protein